MPSEEQTSSSLMRAVLTSAGRWALVLGGVGFCCGFFGPIVLSPDANQGPLLGIFITGPSGALAGGVLGAIVGLLQPSPRRSFGLLGAAAIGVAAVSLFFSLPSPQFRADIVDGEILGCDSPSGLKNSAIEYWDNRVSKVTWAPPRDGWKEDFERMLSADPGVVLRMNVVRRTGLYENRKPWNKGTLTAQPWSMPNQEHNFFARHAGAACEQYRSGSRALYLATGQTAKQWPPEVLSNFLDLQVIEPLPDTLRGLVSD